MISIHDKYVAPFTSKDLPTVVDTNGSQNGASSSEQKKAQKMEAFYYYRAQTDEMMALVRDQKDKLDREVARWCQERGLWIVFRLNLISRTAVFAIIFRSRHVLTGLYRMRLLCWSNIWIFNQLVFRLP